MHGIIFGELKKLVDSRLGGDSWRTVLQEAGLGSVIYMPVGEYPDAHAVAIIETIAKKTGTEVKVVLEEFGEFIAPHLLALYRHMVKPEWKTLDLLENTEQTIHRVVRLRNVGAKPPELKTDRDKNEVLITYTSTRKMCGVAIGIVRGLAGHYQEEIDIKEISCMLMGADACRIRVRAL